MPLGNYGQMNANFYPPLLHFGDCQELNTISKFSTELNIQGCDLRDASNEYLFKPERGPKGETGQDSKLVSRIGPFNIIGRVRLRISFLLGFLQDFFKVSSFIRHLREDIIRGPVQNPEDRMDSVCNQAFFDRPDEGT